MKDIYQAQNAVLALLKHFGIDTKMIREVKISASHNNFVTVELTKIVFVEGKNELQLVPHLYKVTGGEVMPAKSKNNPWNRFFEFVKAQPFPQEAQ